ncbi:MAG: hypothetical protein AAB887_00385 [Patescibacteria group bacterium]
MSHLKWLLLIVAAGLTLRLAAINFLPPSLNWDEVSLGYNAYSLLKTGRDEWGTILPTIIRAYGDYKLPIYVYLAVTSPFFIRLPSIIFGTLLIIVTYLLGRRLASPFVGLTSALLIAISPWTWWISRIALEANVGALLIAIGIYCLLARKLNLGILFLGLSVWAYNSARVFSPLFLTGYWLINRPKLTPIHYSLISIFFIPMIFQLLSSSGQARLNWLTILDSGAITQINQLQSRPGGRLVYNKATYFLYRFGQNYISYLSPNFLFLKGGNHYQFSVQNYGLLYLICLPFFYIGIWYLFRNYKLESRNSLLLWLLLAPVAGSLTRDAPHVLRAIPLLPLPMILTAIGLDRFGRNVKVLFFVVLLLSTMNYLFVTKSYRNNFSDAWQYGYSQVIQFIKPLYSQYDQIVFTKKYGEPHEFVAYFWPWDPADFSQNKSWDYHANWYWVNSLDKIKFVNDWEISTMAFKPNTLVISSPESEISGREIKRINFLNGQPAFIIYEI